MLRNILLFLFVLAGITFSQHLSSQNIGSYPNVDGYKNIDVDLFKGKLGIHIPIFDFQTKHLSLPISLDYSPMNMSGDSSVFYHHDIAGFGWNLTCGGTITRTVNSSPDETSITGNFFNRDKHYDPKEAKESLSKHEAGEDEFEFNFCGYSGLFVYYRGTWLVLSDVDFKVNTIILKNDLGKDELAKITLESPEGVLYTFGGKNAIEYNKSGNRFGSDISTENPIVGWHLTRIQSPEGDQIDLEYGESYSYWYPITKQTTIHTITRFNFLEDWQDPVRSLTDRFPSDEEIRDKSRGYYTTKCTLYRVSSPTNPVMVQFNASDPTNVSSYGLKLDNIELKRDYQVYKKFDLSYNKYPILELESVSESAVSPKGVSTSLPPYQFFYLPRYNNPAPYALNKIIYPTGGYSSFEFEQEPLILGGFRVVRQVSKGAGTDDAEVVTYSYRGNDNMSSGTLSKPTPKDVVFGGSLQGKGGLSFGTYSMTIPSDMYPHLETAGGVNYNPSNTVISVVSQISGNHSIKEYNSVGYSMVWVTRSTQNNAGVDVSKGTERYEFVNYYEKRTEGSGWNPPTFVWTNRNEVGKLKRYQRFDSRMNEEYSVTNIYGNGPDVRARLFYMVRVPFNDPQNQRVSTVEIQDYYIHFFKYNLLEKVELNKGLETYTQYKYDSINNFLRETKIMEHKIDYSTMPVPEEIDYPNLSNTTYSYKYYSDFYDLGVAEYRQEVRNAPVETIVRKDGQVIGAQFIKYTAFESLIGGFNIVRPVRIYSLDISAPVTDYVSPNFEWQVQDPRMKLKMTFDKYDHANGNLLEFHAEGGTPTSMIYDPKYSFLLMEAQNCTYDQLNYGVQPDDILGVKWLRTILPNALITSYTYDPTCGRTSVTTPNGVTKYIEYDAFGRVKAIRDNNKNLLQTTEYNYNLK